VLNIPNLFLFATYSFTQVLCFLSLFTEIVSAAPILLLNKMLHAVIITSWSSSASEMTYIVSSGALNSTHSLTDDVISIGSWSSAILTNKVES